MCTELIFPHLPPHDLRFRRLAGTACAAGLLLQQLDVCLLASCTEKEEDGIKDRLHDNEGEFASAGSCGENSLSTETEHLHGWQIT